MSVDTTIVVLPTYNEADNIAAMVGRVRRAVPEADVLVVDDSSPDGTGALADRLADEDAAVHVLHRQSKEGLGAAYRAGFAWALARGYERIVEMDADGSHQPEQLPDLLAESETVDVVVGSRWVTGGVARDWPLRRKLLSWGGSAYARVILGVPYRDITGGYRVFHAEALRAIGFDSVASQGYCFQIEMLWRAVRAGLTIREVPITFVDREAGTSKMSSGIIREALLRVTIWGAGRVVGAHGTPTRTARQTESSSSAGSAA